MKSFIEKPDCVKVEALELSNSGCGFFNVKSAFLVNEKTKLFMQVTNHSYICAAVPLGLQCCRLL